MLKTEWKKIWFYQKGLLILVLALCAQIVLSLASSVDTTNAISQDEDAYTAYIQTWHGLLTEQMAAEIEAEYYALNHAGDPSAVPQKAAFMELYDQYTYVKENESRRYLLDERGWNTILTHDSFPFVLTLCLLALCVPVFCTEYERDMAGLLRSTENGRGKLARRKLFLMMAVAGGVSIIMQAVQFAVAALSCGMAGWDYPLQSLRFFENSPYLITIGQAYVLVLLFRTLGAMWFAVLIALISVLARRTVLTVFIGIAAVLLPFLFGGSFLKYVLPLPAGWMAGTGYFWGRLSEPQYLEQEIREVVTFRGLTPMELAILCLAFTILFGITVFLTVRFYVGKRRKRSFHRLPCAALLLVIALLSGCAADSENLTTDTGESSRYTIELDRDENAIYATDRESGERFLLNRDPFSAPGEILGIRVTENAVIYAKEVTGQRDSGVLLYQISLRDFSEQMIGATLPDNLADFWGLTGE